MVDWGGIETVLLDMDGTLLDLHFDTHFWTEHVPLRYAQRHEMAVEEAKALLYPRFRAVEGTIDWYCLDYWSRELGLEVALLKEEVDHLIAIHPYVPEFLEAVRNSGRRAVLVTNAHNRSLALKMEKTRLAGHFDGVVCAHDLGLPKENPAFWPRLRERLHFEPATTLLVDDSLSVLRTARGYGIGWLLAVARPDTRAPARDPQDFLALASFKDLMTNLTPLRSVSPSS